MLTSLKIQDYRGISALELPHFSRVNIFIGKNGTHKTSVLECAALASSLSPQHHLLFGKWRDMNDSQEILRSAFKDLDSHKPIQMQFNTGTECCNLQIEATHGFSYKDIKYEQISEDVDNNNGKITGVKHTCSHVENTTQDHSVSAISGQLNGNNLSIKSNLKSQPLGCFYIHARRSNSVSETATLLTDLMESSQHYNEFVQVLKDFNRRVERVFVGYRESRPTILVDIGREKALPLNLLGDGFCRLVLMLTGTLGSNASTLIIDEIDSGLHYSAMESIWSDLLNLTTKNQKQLFCVTHSEEMLQATVNAFASEPQELSVYRLSTQEGGEIKAQYYDYELLKDSFMLDFEVR